MNRFLSRLIVDAIKHCRRQDWRMDVSEDCHQINNDWIAQKKAKYTCLGTFNCPCYSCVMLRAEASGMLIPLLDVADVQELQAMGITLD